MRPTVTSIVAEQKQLVCNLERDDILSLEFSRRPDATFHVYVAVNGVRFVTFTNIEREQLVLFDTRFLHTINFIERE
jgi:hypothetical protein